jgi:hypothetical protein
VLFASLAVKASSGFRYEQAPIFASFLYLVIIITIIIIIIVLSYAPGKLQMDSKTEGGPYPCWGAF